MREMVNPVWGVRQRGIARRGWNTLLAVPDILTYDDLPREVRERLDPLYEAMDRRRYAEVVSGLSEIVDRYPSYINAVYVLGLALRKTGEYSRATERFAAAATIAPDDPRICLGLALGRQDQDDLAGAAEVARRGLPPATAKVRGQLLELIAIEAESDGRIEDAARLFLEAYEACTLLGCLEAHCRLVGIDYAVDVATETPWPISAVERQWMYSEIASRLCDAARAKNPESSPNKLLTGGCDLTARLTSEWAILAGADRARLYQALASRGGFCDCEVLLNAATEDQDQRGLALLAGEIDGSLDDGLSCVRDFLHEDPPTSEARLAPAEEPDEYLGIFWDAAHQRIPLQITDSATIGEILRQVARQPPAARLRMLVGFVGEPPAIVVAGPDGAVPRTRELREGSPAEVEPDWPGLSLLIEQLRTRLPDSRE